MKDLYYTPPSDEIFDDLKRAAMAVWATMSNLGGYSAEKIRRIEHIKNIDDNFMYIFAMFDQNNQRRVVNIIEADTKEALRERMIAGGNAPYLIQAIFDV